MNINTYRFNSSRYVVCVEVLSALREALTLSVVSLGVLDLGVELLGSMLIEYDFDYVC